MNKNNANLNLERDLFLAKKLQVMANDYKIKVTPQTISNIMADLSDIYEKGKSKGWQEGYDEGHREGMAEVIHHSQAVYL